MRNTDVLINLVKELRNRRDFIYHIRFSKEEYQEVKDYADRLGLKVCEVIRLSVKYFIRAGLVKDIKTLSTKTVQTVEKT